MADLSAPRLPAASVANPPWARPAPDARNALPGATLGGVRILLRLEGLAVLAAAVAAYLHLGAGWGAFAMLFLLPDLSFLGYLAGSRAGALAYNAAHSYIGPVALLGLGLAGDTSVALALGLIWSAHIGLDRALGYGLKYGNEFGATHLGRIGRADPW
ncbi:DUF4260 domain-containing protein [Variovorax guangxiensis]|uniref:DUF4260 domain-containing protein n=1 Tax=Variovorax guangxiensis TaxID=1775474 RepID=UPI0028615B3C|nr:DUF4260 domain-containing protein [Variovorax guangxiensis]MDR6857933.1 hypothetical protein [Variovorax guangxiensis]